MLFKTNLMIFLIGWSLLICHGDVFMGYQVTHKVNMGHVIDCCTGLCMYWRS